MVRVWCVCGVCVRVCGMCLCAMCVCEQETLPEQEGRESDTRRRRPLSPCAELARGGGGGGRSCEWEGNEGSHVALLLW